MKERTGNNWPGLDDKLVVTEMLSDPFSPHWKECRRFFENLIQISSIPVDIKEDVVQNAMLSAMKYLPSFQFECRLRTWLARVANSRIIDVHREQTRDIRHITPLNDPFGDEENENGMLNINAPLTTEEECLIREALREAMLGLFEYLSTHANPERNSQIMKKVMLEQYNFQEAAKELDVPAPVVRYIVHSVQHYLRERTGHQPIQPEPPT